MILLRGLTGQVGQLRVIDKNKLSKKISKRLGSVISKASIYDAVLIICEELTSKLSDRESIFVPNFGTLDCYDHHGHIGVNVSSGQKQYFKSFINVKLTPHNGFLILLNNKRDKFKKGKI